MFLWCVASNCACSPVNVGSPPSTSTTPISPPTPTTTWIMRRPRKNRWSGLWSGLWVVWQRPCLWHRRRPGKNRWSGLRVVWQWPGRRSVECCVSSLYLIPWWRHPDGAPCWLPGTTTCRAGSRQVYTIIVTKVKVKSTFLERHKN